MAETVHLKPVPNKTAFQRELERLSALAPEELNSEDLAYLRRIRDCRSSLLDVESELAEVKERKKEREKALNLAITDASTYFDARQLALSLGPK